MYAGTVFLMIVIHKISYVFKEKEAYSTCTINLVELQLVMRKPFRRKLLVIFITKLIFY